MIKQSLFILILSTIGLSANGYAAMILTLSGESNSSIVNFTLSGSSTAIYSKYPGGYTGEVFDVTSGEDPFPYDITSPSAPYGRYHLTSGGGTLANSSTGYSVAIDRITLQDAGLFGFARFGISFNTYGATEDEMRIVAGDELAWSGAGQIDLSSSGLTFGDLAIGTIAGVSDAGGHTGSLVVTAVPIPAAAWLFGSALLGLGAIKRKKS